jgi:LysR family hydrogen peroxide-inducible transcriptional activator
MSQYNNVYICIDKINKEMTLQQLEYIIAVEQHGYFVNAAEACGVTQSTLSLMIKKLEEELDVKIFNRDTHPVTVTEMGRKVIDEAKMAVYHTKQLLELTRTAKEQASGDLSIAMTTTVAPVLMPGLFHYMRTKNPAIRLRVEEMITATIITKLKKAEVDMGIVTYPVNDPDLLEVPLYHERFFAYVSPQDAMYQVESIERSQLRQSKVWTMKDGVRLFDRSQVRSEEEIRYDKLFEGGRVGMLIQITDENGGITIVPESHLHLLPETVKDRIRPIVNPEPQRTIGLVFRKDYVHERMMNIVVKAIKTMVPSEFLDGVIRADYLRL